MLRIRYGIPRYQVILYLTLKKKGKGKEKKKKKPSISYVVFGLYIR